MSEFQLFLSKNPDFNEVYTSLHAILKESESNSLNNEILEEYEDIQTEISELESELNFPPVTKEEPHCIPSLDQEQEILTSLIQVIYVLVLQ